MTMSERLTEQEVHIWYCLCDDPAITAGRDQLLAMLTSDELAKHDRFAFDKDKSLFLVTRCLLRTTLARYAAIRAEDWRFDQTLRGKLFLPADLAAPPLTFNVSHSGKAAVCAVTRNHEVGVDVESTERRTEWKVARQFMSEAELDRFEAADERARRELFYRYWTLKEAYAKALGMGLSLRFTEFSFQLPPDQPPQLAMAGAADDSAPGWHFFQRSLDPHYFLAVAVRNAKSLPPRFVLRYATPLAS